MRRLIPLLACVLLAGCTQTIPSEPRSPRSAVSLRLSLSAASGQVELINNSTQAYLFYRDALSLSVSGKTSEIPPFPKVFPPEKPVSLGPGDTLTWRILIRSGGMYPNGIDRGGLLLHEAKHRVKAVYHCRRSPAEGQSGTIFLDRIESNEVVFEWK